NLDWDNKDVYTAHEIVLLKPLFNKDQTYEKFIHTNLWAFEYFANFPRHKVSCNYRIAKNNLAGNKNLLKKVNTLARNIQLRFLDEEAFLLDLSDEKIVIWSENWESKVLDIYHSLS